MKMSYLYEESYANSQTADVPFFVYQTKYNKVVKWNTEGICDALLWGNDRNKWGTDW